MRRGELTTLPSGLRVASRTLPQAPSPRASPPPSATRGPGKAEGTPDAASSTRAAPEDGGTELARARCGHEDTQPPDCGRVASPSREAARALPDDKAAASSRSMRIHTPASTSFDVVN